MAADWKAILRSNIRDTEFLCDFLCLNEEQKGRVFKCKDFPLDLPRRLADKIEKKTLADPILRQFLPLQDEKIDHPAYSADPLQECTAARTPRLLSKYAGRSLLLASSACAMHCRYCFRRHFSYATGPTDFEDELAALRADATTREAILSGGDPLSLSNGQLDFLLRKLDGIEHIRRVRFHTRFPIGIPERIDDEFVEILARSRAQVWFVIHCNHARELDGEILAALGRIRALGIPLLNQAVLLRGVNDSIESLAGLCEALVDAGIFPGTLNQLDRVAGAAHFEVDPNEGLALIEALRVRLSGYAIPQYVQEVPGSLSKVVVRPTSAGQS
jgi:EF-P beta-lysylation protein EpmB